MTNTLWATKADGHHVPGSGTKLAAGGPTMRGSWLGSALGRSFLDDHLQFQRALGQSAHLHPKALTQAFSHKIPNSEWKEVLVIFKDLWSAGKLSLWCLQALCPARQQSSQALSLCWVLFFKGKTNKRDTPPMKCSCRAAGKISSSCHQSCVFFMESYRNLCPVPSATLLSTTAPWG